MKELSIEEKAKAYDEAYKKVAVRFGSNVADEIFSQFEMSEDERIRKDITAFFKNFAEHGTWKAIPDVTKWIAWLEKQGAYAISWNENTDDNKPQKNHSVLIKTTHGNAEGEWNGKEWIQYRWSCKIKDSDVLYWMNLSELEKQGEQANFLNKIQIGDKVTRNKDGVLVNLSQLNRVAKKNEKQGEQKSTIEMKSVEESLGIDSDTYNNIVDECIYGEQKPAELGENKSKELSLSLQIQAYLNTASDELYAKGKPLCSEKRIEDIHKCMLMWQKLHNAYFYQKSAWSKEDDGMLHGIIAFISTTGCDVEGFETWIDWLKSLKDRVLSQLQSDERNRLLGKLEEWLDEYISNLADVDTATLMGSFINYLDGKLPLKPQSQWKPSDLSRISKTI